MSMSFILRIIADHGLDGVLCLFDQALVLLLHLGDGVVHRLASGHVLLGQVGTTESCFESTSLSRESNWSDIFSPASLANLRRAIGLAGYVGLDLVTPVGDPLFGLGQGRADHVGHIGDDLLHVGQVNGAVAGVESG